MKKNYCYATLLTNEKYICSVIRCKQTMDYFHSKYPFLALIPQGSVRMKNILEKNNIICKEIELHSFQLPATKIDPYYDDTINKLQIFNFVEYDKICFLDADLFLSGNIDDEFDKFNSEKEDVRLYSDFGKDGPAINGMIFILKPQSDFYSTKVLPLIDQYMDDEGIFRVYYLDQTGKRKIPNELVHFFGFTKPWENGISYFRTIRKILILDNQNEFCEKVAKREELDGLMQEWFNYYFTPRAFSYVCFGKNEKDIVDIISLNKRLKDFGCIYSLIVCLTEGNNQTHLMNLLQSEKIPFRIISDEDGNNVLKKINTCKYQFKDDYISICLINNLNLSIDENLDYIFSPTLSEINKNKFIKKYEKDIFFLTF